MSDVPNTLLVITGMGVPPYSARGLTQTLEPIRDQGPFERAVNGEMVDLSIPAMRKYASKITCDDTDTPAIGGIWRGALVTVECVEELAFLTASPAMQERTAVDGSTRTDGDFTFYRPLLAMMVMNFHITTDEYGAKVGWELDLEEQ